MTDLVYEVTFSGVAGDMLRAAFDDCEVETSSSTTTLRCRQDDLHETLERVRSFALELLDVRLVVDSDEQDTS